mgnify:CR=1 FL=1
MYRNLTDLQKVAIDAYYGRSENFSQLNKNGDDIIRTEILEAMSTKMPENKKDFRRWFKANSNELFALIEKTITVVHNDIAFDQFGDWVQTEILDEGDAPSYFIQNTDLFDVSVMATGVGVQLRQKMHNGKLDTKAFKLGVKIYDEFFRFLTGRINWTELVNRVAKSFDHKLATIVSGTLFGAYEVSGNPFHATTNAEGVDVKLQEIVNKLSAYSGEVQIVGTKGALANIKGLGGTYTQDATDKRMFGYIKDFGGVPVYELAQGFDKDAKTYDIPNDTILILPSNEKLVYLAYEGDVEVEESLDKTEFNDRQIEMEMARMARVGIAVGKDFGILKIS